MAELKDLRPFIRICQTIGIFPFRMEIDAETGHFKQFSFSFLNPVTCWHGLLFVSVSLPHLIYSTVELNGTVVIEIIFECIHNLTKLLILSFPFMCYTHIRNSGALVQEFDETLRSFPNSCCNLTRRVYLSISIMLILVKSVTINSIRRLLVTESFLNFIQVSTYVASRFLLLRANAPFSTCFMTLGNLIYFLELGCLIIFYFLWNTIVTNRIEHLSTLITADIDAKPKAFQSGWFVGPLRTPLADR